MSGKQVVPTVLLATFLLTSHAFPQEDAEGPVELYLVEGGPLTKRGLRSREYRKLQKRIESDPSLKDRFDVRIYRSNGVRRGDRGTFLGDLRDSVKQDPNARRIALGYSYGVEQVSFAVEEGIPFEAVFTLDGTRGPLKDGAIIIDFTQNPPKFVRNLVTRTPVPGFRGGFHKVEKDLTVEAQQYTSWWHFLLLKKWDSELDGLWNEVVQRAIKRNYGVRSSGDAGVESKPLENVHSKSYRVLSSKRYWRRSR